MEDSHLAMDEARKELGHEAVKASIDAEVGEKVVQKAEKTTTPQEEKKIEEFAVGLRQKSIGDLASEERRVERGRFVARISQLIDYLFYVVYALLAVRFILALLAAKKSAGFTVLIHNLTDKLYAPFKDIVPTLTAHEGYKLELSLLIALIVYALVHMGIDQLLKLLAHRKVAV